MITIDLYRNQKGEITSFRSRGHASDAPAGESVVCAWVSAATQMALVGLEQQLKYPVDYQVDTEKGILQVTLQRVPDAKSQALLGSMETVLYQLAEQCPQDVRIREHGGEMNV
ncbi:MAG: ribosomal-processing cysteine protease Prp [Acidaminococcaceae bacterium]|nr:ribosomal-processing cysteine protease Prp [Acidaminococcaceae bacterium]